MLRCCRNNCEKGHLLWFPRWHLQLFYFLTLESEYYLELCSWWIFFLFLELLFFSFSFVFLSHTKLRMEYLTDPALIMPILVVTFHFLTAAGFWIYFRRQMSHFENGKLFSVINRRLCPIPFISSHDDDWSRRTGFMYFLSKLRLLLIWFRSQVSLLFFYCLKLATWDLPVAFSFKFVCIQKAVILWLALFCTLNCHLCFLFK